MLKATNLSIVYIADDGTLTKYDSTVENGKISFVTDHLSTWAVVGEKSRLSAGAIVGIVLGALILISILLFFIGRHCDRFNKTGTFAAIATASYVLISKALYAVANLFIKLYVVIGNFFIKLFSKISGKDKTPLVYKPLIFC